VGAPVLFLLMGSPDSIAFHTCPGEIFRERPHPPSETIPPSCAVPRILPEGVGHAQEDLLCWKSAQLGHSVVLAELKEV